MKFKFQIFCATALVFFLSACSNKKKVDSIFYNAKVYTVDSTNSVAEAIAILNGKIEFVGTNKDVLENFESEVKVNLKKQFIYPGLNDAHCHFVGYAGDMFKCQLTGTKSLDEIIKIITDYDKVNNLNFIYGRGWDQNDWEVRQFPNNNKLNIAFSNKPVLLKRIDGHAVLVNEYLLNLAKDVLKPYLNTSYIEIKNGKMTGILFDNALDAVEKLLPKISTSVLTENIIKAEKECFSLGLTSLSDASLNYDEVLLIDSLQKSGILKIRINAMVLSAEKNLEYFEKNKFENTANLRVGSIKIYADGALGSRGACMKKPYTDDKKNYGKINVSFQRLDSIMNWAIKNKYQVCTHAIGDSTNSVALKMYAKHLANNKNLRWRIEHAQVVDKKELRLFNANNIIASVQPTHATSDMYWAEERLGKERIKDAYAYGTLEKAGIRLALGTDFPVEYLNPLYTFYAAISRQDATGYPKNGFQSADKLSRIKALRGMTIDGAYASFEENQKGSIEVGKYADFIVTNFDLMNDSLLKIRNNKITSTFVSGKKVF